MRYHASKRVRYSAQGYEAFAKTLGSISEHAAKAAEEIETDQSNSMYINSVANARQLATQAQVRMLQHPDQAPKIVSQTYEAMDAIQQGAYVNNKDRARLNYYIGGEKDSVMLHGTTTEVKQRQTEAAFTHYVNWTSQLQAYRDAAVSDHAKAETLHKAMIGNIHNLVSTGSMTPIQAASAFKDMDAVISEAQSLHDYMQAGANGQPIDAKTYQTLAASPLNDAPANPNSPINQSTAWMTSYHSSDKTFQGLKSDTINKTLNPQAWSNASPEHRQEIMLMMGGVREADGMINSGEPFPALQREYERLSKSHEVLSYKDQAKRDYLAKYLNNMDSGNYLSVISQTPTGAGIMQNFTSNNAAINAAAIDPAQKIEQLKINKNNMVDQVIAYGEGTHTPAELIKPIPQADIAQVENSFKLGQKPEVALQILRSYSPQNQLYLADSVKDFGQKITLKTIALAGKSITDEEATDFIASQQSGRNYREIDLTTQDGVTDSELKNSINSQISDATKIIMSQYNTNDATILNGELSQAGVKYAKYLSEKKGKFSYEKGNSLGIVWGSSDNVDQAAKFINAAYEPATGANYIFNKKQVGLAKPEMDIVAKYASDQGYKYLQDHVSAADYQAIRDRADLIVTISPKNMIQVKDASGNLYYNAPLTANYVEHAGRENKIAQKKLEDEQFKIFNPLKGLSNAK